MRALSKVQTPITEGVRDLCGAFLYKSSNPIHKGSVLLAQPLPKGPTYLLPSTTITLGVRIPTCESLGHKRSDHSTNPAQVQSGLKEFIDIPMGANGNAH